MKKEFLILNEDAFKIKKEFFNGSLFKVKSWRNPFIKENPNLTGIKFPPGVVLKYQNALDWNAVHSKIIETLNLPDPIMFDINVIRRSVPGLVSAKIENKNLIIFKEEQVIYKKEILHESEINLRSYIYDIASQVTDIPFIFSELESSPRPPVSNPVIDFSVSDLMKNPDQEKWDHFISLIILYKEKNITDEEAIERGMPALLSEKFARLLENYIDLGSFAWDERVKEAYKPLYEIILHGSRSLNFEALYDHDQKDFKNSTYPEGFPLKEIMNEIRMKAIVQDSSEIKINKRVSI